METPAAIFRNLWKEIETEFIGAKLDYEGKVRECQRKRIMGYEISRKLYCGI